MQFPYCVHNRNTALERAANHRVAVILERSEMSVGMDVEKVWGVSNDVSMTPKQPLVE